MCAARYFIDCFVLDEVKGVAFYIMTFKVGGKKNNFYMCCFQKIKVIHSLEFSPELVVYINKLYYM